MIGVTCHIGSQITDLRPFEEAAERMVQLVQTLKTLGVPLKHVGIGGGLGIPYRDETPPSPEQYGAALARIFGPLKLQVILEPGRVIIGNAGILLTRVIRQKQGTDRKFVIVDAGMNDLIRPALYKAYHTIVPVVASSKSVEPVDVVGPVCESADVFQKNYTLPPLQTGDLLALRSAGAYAFVMASNYNARLRPAEVMVDGINTFLVRKREVAEDLWNGEELL
jgi:diaminopimelate decarboxylase